jgi:class 3 adenylate cyclase
MGLHTGEPQRSAEGYVGLDVHRAAHIMSAGHGGQVLLSQTTALPHLTSASFFQWTGLTADSIEWEKTGMILLNLPTHHWRYGM